MCLLSLTLLRIPSYTVLTLVVTMTDEMSEARRGEWRSCDEALGDYGPSDDESGSWSHGDAVFPTPKFNAFSPTTHSWSTAVLLFAVWGTTAELAQFRFPSPVSRM